jgi:hypothetical protein
MAKLRLTKRGRNDAPSRAGNRRASRPFPSFAKVAGDGCSWIKPMTLLIILVVVLLLLGGGGGYYGYRSYGAPGLGGVLGLLVIVLVVFWLFGGLHLGHL